MGDPYKADFVLDSLDLGQTGSYEITYQVAMGCEGDACALTGDNIKVLVNDQVEDVINYNNIGFQKRWMPRSFKFTASNPRINVVKLIIFKTNVYYL